MKTASMTFPRVTRRDWLKLAAAAGGVSFLPSLTRNAGAALRADAPAKRLLVLNLFGGVRSSASLLASRHVRYNPWGLLEDAGTAFPMGKLLDDHLAGEAPPPDADYTLGLAWRNERVPRFREMARELSVIGTWDPERGDHIRARIKEPTGSSAGDQPGLLTRLAAALSRARGPLEVPAFQLQPFAAFGDAGDFAQFAPVSLGGPRSLPVLTTQSATERKATGNDWARDDAMRARLDQSVVARRARNAKALADVFALHRRASRGIGARLAEPWVNVGSQDPAYLEAPYGGVRVGGGEVPLTSGMLVELFAKTLGTPEPESSEWYPSALCGALVVRLLQLGTPALCMELGSFDFHSQERTQAPALYHFLGRLLATFNWVLKRIPDPMVPGSSLFDTTMIVTMSDFSRDPGSANTGYNGGEGSDHGSDPSCYYLAHATMGGGVRGGRVISEVSTDDYRGDRAAVRIDQRGLFATLFWALGLDPKAPEWGLDEATAPFDALFRT